MLQPELQTSLCLWGHAYLQGHWICKVHFSSPSNSFLCAQEKIERYRQNNLLSLTHIEASSKSYFNILFIILNIFITWLNSDQQFGRSFLVNNFPTFHFLEVICKLPASLYDLQYIFSTVIIYLFPKLLYHTPRVGHNMMTKDIWRHFLGVCNENRNK